MGHSVHFRVDEFDDEFEQERNPRRTSHRNSQSKHLRQDEKRKRDHRHDKRALRDFAVDAMD